MNAHIPTLITQQARLTQMMRNLLRLIRSKEVAGIPNPFYPLAKVADGIRNVQGAIDRLQIAIGRIEARLDTNHSAQTFSDHEFQVFSQWGEDGLIEYLLRTVDIPLPLFVEFGVGDYREANTRFLLQHRNWKGLILDADAHQLASLRETALCWQRDLQIVSAFIDRENINELIQGRGISGDIGLLSVDIDGNDYWVWQAITCIQPRIVICEYNALFGPTKKLVIPYDPSFTRDRAHFTWCYYGASLAALESLGSEKGYALVGSNSVGNNAFFVRRDLLAGLRPVAAKEAYREPRFREARDESGKLSYAEFSATQAAIGEMTVVDLDQQREVRLIDALSK